MAAGKQAWRDSSGKALSDYPRPSLAVDTAVLTVNEGLMVLLVPREPATAGGRTRTTWGLPGTFLHAGERLSDAVLRSLRDKAGVTGRSPEQLQVFDRLNRDDRGWVLSVAHLDVVPLETAAASEREASGPRWCSINELPRLAFDHAEIVELAVERVRKRYTEHPDPHALLLEPFTLRRLQQLHEAVLGEELVKDTFRRRMLTQLKPSRSISSGNVGKPARLFRRS